MSVKKALALLAAVVLPLNLCGCMAHTELDKEAMEAYLSIRQSPAYQATPGFRLMMEMKKLNQQNGYNDVFLPAMRKLSPAYEAYYQKLLLANEALLKAYPEANGQQE